MSVDVFAQKRKRMLSFFALLALLTLGSIIITEYDVARGFTSIFRALRWGAANFYPDARSLSKLPAILAKLRETILMSIAATTTAAIFALLLALGGSRSTRRNQFFAVASRGVASFFRNIPLAAWAMVLMLAFSQSPLTGYLALFCGSLGFLTRAFVETIDEVSSYSVEALSATGAGYWQIVFQGVLPCSLPLMISWLLYMIETNIRDATLVGILTGTGIGFAFELYYKSLNYHAASLVIITIVATVMAIEFFSNHVRRVIL